VSRNINKHTKIAARGLAAAVLLAASGAIAQQPLAPRPAPPAQRPAPPVQRPAPLSPVQNQTQNQTQSQTQLEVPQRTTATYNDWVLQCETATTPPAAQVCDMAQVTQVQGRNVPFSRIAVAHPEKDQPIKLIVQVPVNASFGTNVRIQTSDEDPGIQAPFTNCTPNGCFAEFELKEELLKRLRTATGVGKVSFADAGAHPVAVPMSFNGFSQALDALLKK
jgi:invasion protein IalB